MILALILGFLYVTAANESAQVEEVQPSNSNCTRLLHEEETITEPSPTFPTTSFTCWGRYDGYYADIEVDCTIFHYCQTWQYPSGLNETVKWDFACPQSTIFNQKILSCTPPNISFDCQESPNFYWVNFNLTTTTTTPSPTVEASTPGSNVGQQLIVGVEQHSVSFKESENATEPTTVTESDITESGSGSGPEPEPASNVTQESSSIHFPL